MNPLIGPMLVAGGVMLCVAALAAGMYMIPRGGRMPLAPALAGYAAVIVGAAILATQ